MDCLVVDGGCFPGFRFKNLIEFAALFRFDAGSVKDTSR